MHTCFGLFVSKCGEVRSACKISHTRKAGLMVAIGLRHISVVEVFSEDNRLDSFAMSQGHVSLKQF